MLGLLWPLITLKKATAVALTRCTDGISTHKGRRFGCDFQAFVFVKVETDNNYAVRCHKGHRFGCDFFLVSLSGFKMKSSRVSVISQEKPSDKVLLYATPSVDRTTTRQQILQKNDIAAAGH